MEFKDKKNVSNIGGLVGELKGGIIKDSFSEEEIIINGSASKVGGLVGSMVDGEIQNSSTKMRIIINKEEVFNELKMVLEQIDEVNKRNELIQLVEDMENSVGKPTFNGKYKAFVSTVADHMTLVNSILPKLTEFLL